MNEPIVCNPKALPRHQMVAAAETAVGINPVNHPRIEHLSGIIPGFVPTREHLALITTKYWGNKGVQLTVGFLDNPPDDLRQRILLHMNAWNQTANVSFVQTGTDPQVRIGRAGGAAGGYWSYVGTDILHAAAGEATMNLEGFTMSTPESEFHRVVRHETGHTLGFPHEHMRAELVGKVDPAKAIAYYARTQGWSKDEVLAQVLTPLDQASLLGTLHADSSSIMCYQIPGEITKDGEAIVGGLDIDPQDFAFAAQVYPKDAGALVRAPDTSAAFATAALASRAVQEATLMTSMAPVLCFAPGTDPRYIAAVTTALRTGRSLAGEADAALHGERGALFT